MSDEAGAIRVQAFDHGSRREWVVREILTDLFMGKYAAGQRMRVESLAARFEVSATPVREALVELAGVGIVELQPNRGAVLRPFGPEQIQELVQVRRILECEAIRTACERLAPFELTQLEQELQALIEQKRDENWSHATRLLDVKLHQLIAQRCGSERLAYEISRYAVLFDALRNARHAKARANYTHMEENAEHLAIVRAMADRDVPAAVAAMTEHINQTARVLIKALFGIDEGN